MNAIKHFSLYASLLIFISSCLLSSCKETEKKSPSLTFPGTVDAANLQEINGVIHNFYAWYDVFLKHESEQNRYLVPKENHLTVDDTKLTAYFSKISKSGFVSKEYFEREAAYLKRLESFWAKESIEEGPPFGVDSDRFFCAQDWDLKIWTTAPATAIVIGNNKVRASIPTTTGPDPSLQTIELTKENGKWLIPNFSENLGNR